jgi:hypothetical protein
LRRYAKVVDIPNSMTVLDEFVPMAVDGGALHPSTSHLNLNRFYH